MKRYSIEFKTAAISMYNACKNYSEVSRTLGVSDETIRLWCNPKLSTKRSSYYKENKTNFAAYNRQYYKDNKDRENERSKKYLSENRKAVNKQRMVYHANRYKNDINYRLKFTLRNRIRDVLYAQNAYKNKTTEELVGCTIDAFKLHIESQFTAGMTWNNYGKGGWVLDHILPCSSFDLSDSDQQKQCFNYTNIQPLWELDNLRKSDKLIP